MLEYTVKADFDGGRWFQAKVLDDAGTLKLELKMNPNTLVISTVEQRRITSAVLGAVEAITRFTSP